MSKETLLQKEFTEKDIKRIRNLVSGNYGDSTQTQVGYSRKHVDRKEGDVWEENGKTWTIKNNIRISISKLAEAKKLSFVPFLCPSCSKPMKSDADKKMHKLQGMCLTCVVKIETKLKLEGKYKEYEDNIVKNNVVTALDDFVNGFDDFLEFFEDKGGFVTEHGDIEDWHGKALNKQKLREEMLKEVAEAKAKLNL